MKKYIILSLAALSFLTSTGCMDDYLDDPSPSETGTVSPDAAYNSKENATSVLAGLIRQQRTQWDVFQSTDAGGLYAMLFARAVKGSDIQLNGSWYNFDYQNDNREPTYRRTQFNWRFPYMMIGRANLFIDGVEKSTGIADSDKAELIAQAKAFRGFYYYQLALEFNLTYKYNPQAAAPPVYTEIDLTGKPMTTLQALYDQIVSDLTYAYENAPASRLDNSWINKNVAAAMLSNVYLTMENWSGAESMAKAAYNNNVSTALHTVSTYNPSGFDNADDKEWLWSMTQQGDQSSYYYAAPHAFMDYGPGYNNGFVNSTFQGLFASNDRRKEAIVRLSATLPTTDVRYYKTTKFKFAFTSSMPIYRTPEFVLVAAEAAARQGKTTESQAILNAFKSTRYIEFVNEGLTGQALIDEILLERRKEMYGENGIQWFDAKRLQQGITRTGNHAVMVNLAPNDKRFYLKVPQVEIDNNPNIDASVNADR
jgi:starch-binding outer membrane protein, SusD/RagB family